MVPTVVGVSITNVGNYLFVLGISGLVWLLGFAVFGLLGVWQTLVVRWVVGLNEGKPDDATYAVDASFETVRDQAVKKDFCDFWRLKLQDHKPELVLRRRVSEGIGLHANVVLVITPSEDGRTIIHGSAFAEGLYEIIISEYASYCRGCMIDNLVGRLSGKATKALVQDKASLTRISHAFVEASTRSKFTVARARMTGGLTALKEIPHIFLFVVVVTLGAWVLVNVLFGILSKANIDIEPIPVIEINVAFLLVTVGEIIVPAWEAIRQRKPHSTKRS